MKKSPWLSSLILIPLSAALILSGCGKSELTPQDPGVKQSSPPPASQGSSTGDSAQGSTQPPAPTQPAVDIAHTNYEGASLAFQSASIGWIGGQGFILHTSDGGAHWAVQYQGPYQIIQLSAPDATTGFALGQIRQSSGQLAYALLSTVDGGQHWNVISHPSPITSDPFGIGELHFDSATNGTLGGHATTDGGKTWHTLPVPAGSLYNPLYLDQTNGLLLYAKNNTDTNIHIQRTTDGGKSWSDIMTKTTQYPLGGGLLKATSPDDIWALIYGGTGMTQTSYSLFHTTDGGVNWQTVLANSTAGGGPAPGVDTSTPDPSKQGPRTKPGDLEVVDAQTAYLTGSCPACGIGTISVGHTTDGGKTWTNFPQTFPGADGELSFVSPTQGWLLVNTYQKASVLYETTNGGTSWTQEFVFGQHAPQNSQ